MESYGFSSVISQGNQSNRDILELNSINWSMTLEITIIPKN